MTDGIRASHVVSQSANKRKKLPLQEIEVEFVYHRQEKMKNFSSSRQQLQIVGEKDHCYFLGMQ